MSEQVDDRHPIGLAIAKGFATGEWIAWEGDHRLKIPPTEAELFDLGVRWAVKEVIAHLWQMADDPTVMREVSKAMFPYGVMTHAGDSSGEIARGYTEVLLTALLGPRPEEQEAE